MSHTTAIVTYYIYGSITGALLTILMVHLFKKDQVWTPIIILGALIVGVIFFSLSNAGIAAQP